MSSTVVLFDFSVDYSKFLTADLVPDTTFEVDFTEDIFLLHSHLIFKFGGLWISIDSSSDFFSKCYFSCPWEYEAARNSSRTAHIWKFRVIYELPVFSNFWSSICSRRHKFLYKFTRLQPQSNAPCGNDYFLLFSDWAIHMQLCD